MQYDSTKDRQRDALIAKVARLEDDVKQLVQSRDTWLNIAQTYAADWGEVRDENILIKAKNAALIEAGEALLNACYNADNCEELPEQIDGSLLDAMRKALSTMVSDTSE